MRPGRVSRGVPVERAGGVGRRDGSAAARSILCPMPGYRAARGTARAVFARPAPRPGSRRSALCARVPRRHGRHGWCPPARSQDQDQARAAAKGCGQGPRATGPRVSCTRRRPRGSGRTARGRRARGRSGHAAGTRYGTASVAAPATGDRRAGHDSLPRIHVRVTKRARRATEIELSAALTLTVQRPPQQHPGQTKPPTHARQQAHTRRGIRTGAQSPRYV